MRYFLAGGAVRDMLLGIAPDEFDIVFDGTAAEFLRQHNRAVSVGRDKKITYIVNGHDHMPLAGSIPEDLANRDLTINALLLDEYGVIHALPSTFDDLRDGVLRHASPDAFTDDPVRVLRAARFSAVLPGFSISPETLGKMREAAAFPEFSKIAAERAGRECMRAMAGEIPGNFLRALAKGDCLAPWLSPFDAGLNIPAGPAEHHGDASVFSHTCEMMDAIASMPYARALPKGERALAVWMALCHDLGKITTDPVILPRHLGHEKRGADIANNLADRLRLPTVWKKAGAMAASLHMKAGRYNSLRPGARVDLLRALNASRLFAPFCALTMADSGNDSLGETMHRDMRAMLAVTLHEEWRNRGSESAARLRELRAEALARQKLHP